MYHESLSAAISRDMTESAVSVVVMAGNEDVSLEGTRAPGESQFRAKCSCVYIIVERST